MLMMGGLQIRKVREYQGGAFVSPLLLAARGGHLAVCKVVRREVEERSFFYYFGKMDLTENFTKERMVSNMKTTSRLLNAERLGPWLKILAETS